MKYLPIFAFLLLFGRLTYHSDVIRNFSIDGYNIRAIQTDAEGKAFNVLRSKCNVCHATKKRTDIFTMENMDSLAADIHKQVFVKGKMPKGRKIKLTESESQALKDWLKIVLGNVEI